MFDISKLSARYRVRRMKDSDADSILALCLENTQYYQYCGKQPSKALILNDLHITPPNTSSEAKFYVGFYDGETLVAVMDLIAGYPDAQSAFIGFFMMNKQLQGKQIGSGIIREACHYIKASGMKSVLLGIDQGNPQSTHFWKKNGFHVIREVQQDDGTILVAEKSLSPDESHCE
ncbi:MAG: GNAT family N-acetyltransferase [Clostridia bacterium]|nr:GNAT family N-acetyltransferase [Clostridia bacterium]